MSWLLQYYPGDGFLQIAVNVLLQATLVMLLAFVVSRLFLRRSAAARYGLWLCAMVYVLLSPAVAWSVNRAEVSLIRISFTHGGTPQPESLPKESTPVIPVREARAIPDAPKLTGHETRASRDVKPAPFEHTTAPPDVAPAPLEAVAAPPEDAPATPGAVTGTLALVKHQPPPLSWTDMVRAAFVAALALWAAGAIFLFVRMVYGLGAYGTLRRSVRPLDTGGLENALRQVRKTLQASKLPPVLTSSLINSPISIGILKPLVILPRNLLQKLKGEKLRDVLLHECAHVLHRDHLVRLLQCFTGILLWMHPLVRLLNREMARAREEVCDNYVLRCSKAPRYARTLLELAEKTTILKQIPAAIGLAHPRWKLEDRIAGLLDGRRKLMTRMSSLALVVMVAAFLAAGIIIATCKVVSAQPGPPPEKVEKSQDEIAEETEKLLDKISKLLDRAEEAEREGRIEEAIDLLNEAEKLARKLMKLRKHRGEPEKEKKGRRVPPEEIIERAKREIEELRRMAKEAEERGDHDEARELMERAEHIKREAGKMIEAHKRGKHPEGEEQPRRPVPPDEMIEHAKREIHKLREMAQEAEARGDHDEARELMKRAEHIERKMEQMLERERRGRVREEMPEEERKWVEEAKREVEELREASHKAKEEGHMEKAGALWREAEALEGKIAEFLKHREKGRQHEAAREREERIAQLKREIEHLHAMAREAKERDERDKAEKLMHKAGELERELKELLGEERHRGEKPDVEEAIREIHREREKIMIEMEKLKEQIEQLHRLEEELIRRLKELDK